LRNWETSRAHAISQFQVQALDPARLLMTLGANPSQLDHTHGNTPLHWAILSRNTLCIATLMFKGKACLEIPNLRGDTPLKMLQQHLGSPWLGDKINERVKELTQQQNHSKRGRRCLLRLTNDKRLRFWTMVGLPFLFFYATGQILSVGTYFIIKVFVIACLYAVATTIGRWMFDEQLLTLLPLSIYLATKVINQSLLNFLAMKLFF
jgi:palmitoyltransferase